jgi:hypothetical protein
MAWKLVVVEVRLVVILVLCSLNFTTAADRIFASTPAFPHWVTLKSEQQSKSVQDPTKLQKMDW